MELWMHLGGLLSYQEARVALGLIASCNSYASFVLSSLPCASITLITPWLHAARLPFLKYLIIIAWYWEWFLFMPFSKSHLSAYDKLEFIVYWTIKKWNLRVIGISRLLRFITWTKFIEFISPVRSEMMWSVCLNWKIYCDDHSSLSSTTAVQNELFHILRIILLLTGDMNSINWPRCQCVAS